MTFSYAKLKKTLQTCHSFILLLSSQLNQRSLTLSNRCQLFDQFQDRTSQHAVKLDFLQRIHRQHPPTRRSAHANNRKTLKVIRPLLNSLFDTSDGHLWWCWNIAWLIAGSRCHKVTVPEPAYSDGHGRNPWRGADLHRPSRIFCPTALSQWRRTVSGVYKQPAICFCFWIQYCSWTSVFVMLWCSGSKTSSRCSAALWGIYGTDKHLLGIQSTQKRLIWNSETLATVPPQQAARTLLQKFPVAHVLMDCVRTVRPQMVL